MAVRRPNTNYFHAIFPFSDRSQKDSINAVTTDCSPLGYFLVPLYTKGEYTLRVSKPRGWSFEPEQYDINYDGKTDLCSLGKDVNFVFKGFGITGSIAGILGDANDVQVLLRSADGKDVRSTVSDIKGDFHFTPVVPGQYTIEVSRQK